MNIPEGEKYIQNMQSHEIDNQPSDSKIYNNLRMFAEGILEKIGSQSHLEGIESSEPFDPKVCLYRMLFKSYLNFKMYVGRLRSDEIFPTEEVSLERYGELGEEPSGTVVVAIPGVLTRGDENNKIFWEFFSGIQHKEDGSPRDNPVADRVVIPNLYYNARDLDQVEYFWEYLQELLKEELESADQVVLVGHSFGGILATALIEAMVKDGIDPGKLGIITYCTPHGECALTRKTHFQPARDTIGYTGQQVKDVSTIVFAGEKDQMVGADAAQLLGQSGEPIKVKMLPNSGHSGDITQHQRTIAAAIRATTKYTPA